MGNGLYIKKDGDVCEIETDGKRLLLEPSFETRRWTIFEEKNGKIYDGRGLLLGPNIPLKNIPILNRSIF